MSFIKGSIDTSSVGLNYDDGKIDVGIGGDYVLYVLGNLCNVIRGGCRASERNLAEIPSMYVECDSLSSISLSNSSYVSPIWPISPYYLSGYYSISTDGDIKCGKLKMSYLTLPVCDRLSLINDSLTRYVDNIDVKLLAFDVQQVYPSEDMTPEMIIENSLSESLKVKPFPAYVLSVRFSESLSRFKDNIKTIYIDEIEKIAYNIIDEEISAYGRGVGIVGCGLVDNKIRTVCDVLARVETNMDGLNRVYYTFIRSVVDYNIIESSKPPTKTKVGVKVCKGYHEESKPKNNKNILTTKVTYDLYESSISNPLVKIRMSCDKISGRDALVLRYNIPTDVLWNFPAILYGLSQQLPPVLLHTYCKVLSKYVPTVRPDTLTKRDLVEAVVKSFASNTDKLAISYPVVVGGEKDPC